MDWRRIHPPHAVDRPALRAKVDAGMSAPLTLIVAPAGSGKSVLLAQWASTLPSTRVVWLDVTAGDDDPARFLRRFERAVAGSALPSAAADLVSGPEGWGEPVIEALATAFSHSDEKTVVILDDLHNLSNRALVADLWSLTGLLPPHVRFVFSSRIDLRLDTTRRALEHGLTTIRQADLAFDPATTARLLSRIAHAPADADTAARVHEKTEGWPAGVQLCGLSLRERAGTAPVDDERLAMEYLAAEVLAVQSPARRRALVRLSVLDELSPGLVEAVGDVADGTVFLRDLVGDSMFVVPSAQRPDRYRLHHLFRSVLLLQLRASNEFDEGELARTAAAWHRAHGEPEAAIGCLLSAGQWDDAITAILPFSRELYERGDSQTLALWLAAVPRPVRRARVEAELLYAIAERMSGRAAAAEDLLRSLIDDPAMGAGLAAVAHLQIGSCVQFRPHAETYLEQSRRAQQMLASASQPALDSVALFGSPELLMLLATLAEGRALFLLGALEESRAVLREARDLVPAGYGHYRIHTLGALALTSAWDGHLNEATEAADEALHLARDLELLAHPAAADAYLARATVALQRGAPDAGALALHEGHVRAIANARHQLAWIAHTLARMIEPEGMAPAALPPEGPPPPLARLGLRVIGYFRRREAGNPAPLTAGSDEPWSTLVFEEVASLLMLGKPDAAAARLARAPLGDLSPVADTQREVALAWIAHASGDTMACREHLRVALDIAAPEELVQPFHFAGRPVMTLLAGLPGEPSAFRRLVTTTFPSTRGGSPRPTAERLTTRELELLAYLPSRLSNSEVAARCYVSLNTVKTHLAHIYRKLGASSRDEAVARAIELGLLDPTGPFVVG